MSRSGYTSVDKWELIKWRGQVASAIRGKRGQAFLCELLEALDAMPKKRLIAHKLRCDGEVCALGSVGARRCIPLEALDSYDYHSLAACFGIAHQFVQEIEWPNAAADRHESPEQRWKRMRDWAARNLREGANGPT